GFELLIEAFELFPDVTWRQQKSSGAVVNVAAEHVHRRERIVASAVTEAGAVPPDDAAGFLKRAVKQDQPASHGSDPRRASDRLEGGLQSPGQYFGIVIQKQQILSLGLARRLIDGQQEIPVLGIPNNACAVQLIE